MSVYSSYLESEAVREHSQRWAKEIEEVSLCTQVPRGIKRNVVQIPVCAREQNLSLALSALESCDLDPRDDEVIILINNGTAGEVQRILAETISFSETNPLFPLRCFVARNLQIFENLSQIRAALDILAMSTLPDMSDNTLGQTMFITHDADMRGIAPDYFEQMYRYFGNPNVYMIGGDVKVRTEHPIVLLLHSVDVEMYRVFLKTGHCKPRTYGGNVALRASTLFSLGGHSLSLKRKANNALRDALLESKGIESVLYGQEMYVETSDRREIACVEKWIAYVRKNLECELGLDLGYSQNMYNFRAPLDSIRYMEERITLIESQLTQMLFKNIMTYLSFDQRSSGLNIEYKSMQREELVSRIENDMDLCAIVDEVIDLFTTICKRLGVSIKTDGNFNVSIENFETEECSQLVSLAS